MYNLMTFIRLQPKLDRTALLIPGLREKNKERKIAPLCCHFEQRSSPLLAHLFVFRTCHQHSGSFSEAVALADLCVCVCSSYMQMTPNN